jgi:hypothetical protein
MRIAIKLLASIALISVSCAASAKNWEESVRKLCDVPLSKMASCTQICNRAAIFRKIDDLSVETQEICQFAFALDAVRRSYSKPCRARMCLYNLRPESFMKRERYDRDSYSGSGYHVVLNFFYSETGSVIHATIADRQGQVSKFRRDCAGDGYCEKWMYRSGPIKKAEIWIPFYHDPKQGIAIATPK